MALTHKESTLEFFFQPLSREEEVGETEEVGEAEEETVAKIAGARVREKGIETEDWEELGEEEEVGEEEVGEAEEEEGD